MFQVKDIMTKDVFTLRETDTLSAARDLMNLLRIRHIPVVDDHGRFVGLVTRRDILAATVSKPADMAAAAPKEIEAAIPVFEIMQREATTIAEDTSLEEALRCFCAASSAVCLSCVMADSAASLPRQTFCALLSSPLRPPTSTKDPFHGSPWTLSIT